MPPRALNGVEIDFVAGFGEAGTGRARSAAAGDPVLAAHWYEFRGELQPDDQPVGYPAGYERLIAGYRTGGSDARRCSSIPARCAANWRWRSASRAETGWAAIAKAGCEVATLFGRIEPVSAETVFGADQTLESVTHRVTLRWRGDVKSGMRLSALAGLRHLDGA